MEVHKQNKQTRIKQQQSHGKNKTIMMNIILSQYSGWFAMPFSKINGPIEAENRRLGKQLLPWNVTQPEEQRTIYYAEKIWPRSCRPDVWSAGRVFSACSVSAQRRRNGSYCLPQWWPCSRTKHFLPFFLNCSSPYQMSQAPWLNQGVSSAAPRTRHFKGATGCRMAEQHQIKIRTYYQ